MQSFVRSYFHKLLMGLLDASGIVAMTPQYSVQERQLRLLDNQELTEFTGTETFANEPS